MTKKMYEVDSYCREYDGNVQESFKEANLWKVVLDATYFYPEGGGQPADKGTINGINVVDVRESKDGIVHLMEANPGKGKAHCIIDWNRRYDYMQQHTGQHIISASFMKVGQWKTLSVHLGESYSTIEIECASIDLKQIQVVERQANETITRNLPVDVIMTDTESASKYSVRRLQKDSGPIRLVKIGEVDCVGCGGVHCRTTGEIGLVKAISTERIRGNIRIAWKIGERAYRDYGNKHEIVSCLKNLFSTDERDLVNQIERYRSDCAEQKTRIVAQTARLGRLLAEDLLKADLLTNTNDSLLQVRVICQAWTEEDSLVKEIAKEMVLREKVVFLFTNKHQAGVAWSVGCSTDLQFSFDNIKREFLTLFSGRGGGSTPLWQGIGQAIDVEKLFGKFRELVPLALK